MLLLAIVYCRVRRLFPSLYLLLSFVSSSWVGHCQQGVQTRPFVGPLSRWGGHTSRRGGRLYRWGGHTSWRGGRPSWRCGHPSSHGGVVIPHGVVVIPDGGWSSLCTLYVNKRHCSHVRLQFSLFNANVNKNAQMFLLIIKSLWRTLKSFKLAQIKKNVPMNCS